MPILPQMSSKYHIFILCELLLDFYSDRSPYQILIALLVMIYPNLISLLPNDRQFLLFFPIFKILAAISGGLISILLSIANFILLFVF